MPVCRTTPTTPIPATLLSMDFSLSVGSIHELGQRANQEDSIYPPDNGISGGGLFILCDGMGGHAAGEVASGLVCETMSRYILSHPSSDGFFDESQFQAALDAAYDALDAADDSNEAKKMGTTLTLVKFHSGGCFVAHIGDSRVYHIRPATKKILHVTRDHSLVNELIAVGEMTPEEARTSSQKNVITRAMQPNQEHRTKADCTNLTDLRPGDYLYMCSDGMLEQMEDRELVLILAGKGSDAEKIERLRNETSENRDNHSAHLIRINGENGATPTVGNEEEGHTGSRRIYWLSVAIAVLLFALSALFLWYKQNHSSSVKEKEQQEQVQQTNN